MPFGGREDCRAAIEAAARAFPAVTRCRARGIQGSNTDFLLCAVAKRYQFPIMTTDDDFVKFGRVLPVRLYAHARQPDEPASPSADPTRHRSSPSHVL